MSWETPIHLVRPVRLWSADPIHSRRVSWLELFFDLIFVAAVAQVGVPLGEDYTVHGLARYALSPPTLHSALSRPCYLSWTCPLFTISPAFEVWYQHTREPIYQSTSKALSCKRFLLHLQQSSKLSPLFSCPDGGPFLRTRVVTERRRPNAHSRSWESGSSIRNMTESQSGGVVETIRPTVISRSAR